MDENKVYEHLQLKFENETGQFFNGQLSDEDAYCLNTYISELDEDEIQLFFLRFIKIRFLNDDFIKIDATLEDIDEIVKWLRYTFK